MQTCEHTDAQACKFKHTFTHNEEEELLSIKHPAWSCLPQIDCSIHADLLLHKILHWCKANQEKWNNPLFGICLDN